MTKTAAIGLANLDNSLAMTQGQDGTWGPVDLLSCWARKQLTPWLCGGMSGHLPEPPGSFSLSFTPEFPPRGFLALRTARCSWGLLLLLWVSLA